PEQCFERTRQLPAAKWTLASSFGSARPRRATARWITPIGMESCVRSIGKLAAPVMQGMRNCFIADDRQPVPASIVITKPFLHRQLTRSEQAALLSPGANVIALV